MQKALHKFMHAQSAHGIENEGDGLNQNAVFAVNVECIRSKENAGSDTTGTNLLFSSRKPKDSIVWGAVVDQQRRVQFEAREE